MIWSFNEIGAGKTSPEIFKWGEEARAEETRNTMEIMK